MESKRKKENSVSSKKWKESECEQTSSVEVKYESNEQSFGLNWYNNSFPQVSLNS